MNQLNIIDFNESGLTHSYLLHLFGNLFIVLIMYFFFFVLGIFIQSSSRGLKQKLYE